MTNISEIIKALEEIRAKRGEVPVYIYDVQLDQLLDIDFYGKYKNAYIVEERTRPGFGTEPTHVRITT